MSASSLICFQVSSSCSIFGALSPSSINKNGFGCKNAPKSLSSYLILRCHLCSLALNEHTVCFFLSLSPSVLFVLFHLNAIPRSLIQFHLPGYSLIYPRNLFSSPSPCSLHVFILPTCPDPSLPVFPLPFNSISSSALHFFEWPLHSSISLPAFHVLFLPTLYSLSRSAPGRQL